jgi:hypothetical protein
MTHHVLKTWPPFYEAVAAGLKPFEVRQETDRTYEVGDTLCLREWVPTDEVYTGRQCWAVVTYVLRGREWGLSPLTAVLGIRVIHEPMEDRDGR